MTVAVKQAVFLVGGRGTRLGELTETVPKPMLLVGGKPFLDYLIETAVYHGVNDIVLLCGYLAGSMAEHYAGPGPAGSAIHLVVEPEPAGTAGALLCARDLLESRFFLGNGDSLFAIDWGDLAAFAFEGDAVATLALRARAPGRRSGTVDLDGDHIRGFHAPEENCPGPVNAGLYAARRDILDWIDETPCSIEQQIFPRLAAAGRLRGKIHEGYFIDIGIPEDFARAQQEVPQALAASARSE